MEEYIIPIKHSEDWFLAQLYMASKPESATFRILKTLNRYIKCSNRDMFYSIDIFDKTIRSKPLNDLADDCLLTIALFRKHIEELYKYRAAPPLHYYIEIGTNSFMRLGYYDIARDYEFWIDFLREHIFA
jgi:hypothetical protein